MGARLEALRLRINPPADDASRSAARGELLSYISTSGNSADTREAIDLFDKVFTTTTPPEELVIARAAAKSGLPDRAATAYAKALAVGLGDATDDIGYGSVLFRLRRYADAATQFAKVRAPPNLAAAAQYQRARAQIALGNTLAGRTTLRAITTAYPRDTSSASALLLLADLATDDNRDQDARQALTALLKRFPSAKWHQWDPASRENARAGSKVAFGEYADAQYHFDQADVILSLDADFLGCGPGGLRYARDFASRRRPEQADRMNRLYAVESMPTSTGSRADHRLALKPSEVETFARRLAEMLGASGRAGEAGRVNGESTLTYPPHSPHPPHLPPQ